MSSSMTTVADTMETDVKELPRPNWKRPMMRHANTVANRTQIPLSSDSGRSLQGGTPTAQILNCRYDNARIDGNAKVHARENTAHQNAGGDGYFFQVSGTASVHTDPSAFRDGSVHYQVLDSPAVFVGFEPSKRTGSFKVPDTPHGAFTPRHTYSGTHLSFEASTLHLNRKRKLEYQAGKVTDTAPYTTCPNCLYPKLRSPRIKTEFAHIARNFQLLDQQFALYFRSIVRSKLAREDICHLLQEARATVRKVQHELPEHQEVVLGDLGQFCEDITSKARDDMPEYTSTDGSVDARLHYLQDAYLDIPYWYFILELIANEQSKTKELAIRVMSHVKLDAINRRAKLLENAATWTGVEVEDLKEMGPILNGIEARLECLDNVYHGHALDLETSPLLSRLMQSRSISVCFAEASLANKVTDQDDTASAHQIENEAAFADSPLIVIEFHDKSKEVSIDIGLFALIVLPSFLLGAYAFHISMKSNEPGTFHDADFWNLLQSTLISSSGSLALAISFFLHDRKKIAHWTTAYTMACLIWIVSLICGIVSVAVYTLTNTAWSSMMSTLSGVLALLAPLLLILASTPEVGSVKGEKQKTG